MSRQDTEVIKGLRDIFDYRENFDVFLSCCFDKSEKGEEKFELYDRIGEVVKNLGKRIFLPHREIRLDWVSGKVFSIPNSIIIPTSDLVLCYLGLESTDTGIMLASASINKIPIIYLFENDKDFDKLKAGLSIISLQNEVVDRGIFNTRDYTDKLEYESVNINNGNLTNLENCIKRFYYYEHYNFNNNL